MKLKIFLVLMSLCSFTTLMAQIRTHVVLWSKDGTHVGYSLSDKPILSFSNNELVVITPEMNINYPLSDIAYLTYTDETQSGIINVQSNKHDISVVSETLIYHTIHEKDRVSVYSINGILMLETVLTQKGEHRIPLSKLSKGIYLIKTIDRTFKITIK